MNRFRNIKTLLIIVFAMAIISLTANAVFIIGRPNSETATRLSSPMPTVLWACSPGVGLPQTQPSEPFAYVVCGKRIAVIQRGNVFDCNGDPAENADDCDQFSTRAAGLLRYAGAEKVRFAYGELHFTLPGAEPASPGSVYMIDQSLKRLLDLTAVAD